MKLEEKCGRKNRGWAGVCVCGGGECRGGANQNTLYACMKFSSTHTHKNGVHLRSRSFSSTRSDVTKRSVSQDCDGELRPLLKL